MTIRAPLLAVSIGCPAGVGPEVAVRAAARERAARVLLVGEPGVVRRAARVGGIAAERLVDIADPAELRALPRGRVGVWTGSARLVRAPKAGKPSRDDGAAQLAWIDQACDLVAGGACDALVTGPVSKHAIAASGARGSRRFRGHTEHLARRLGAHEPVMAFVSQALAVALVTTHLPLRQVPRAVTPERVAAAAYWLARMLHDLAAGGAIAVAALNPHAGEHGLLGDEETTKIAPGIALARRRLARAHCRAHLSGPIGAETAFRLASRGAYDGVVAMYHDQATIPCKLLGFGEAVNVTLGLPIVRTSVDHGTAYDLAGTGRADDRGMRAALALAGRLAAAKS